MCLISTATAASGGIPDIAHLAILGIEKHADDSILFVLVECLNPSVKVWLCCRYQLEAPGLIRSTERTGHG